MSCFVCVCVVSTCINHGKWWGQIIKVGEYEAIMRRVGKQSNVGVSQSLAQLKHPRSNIF
jgi:hypothetical protein